MTYGIVGTRAGRPGSGWYVFPIGGGGYLTGTSISADGATKLVRTDTQGAYRYNSNSGLWEQLITQVTMPSGYADPGGVYEICVAPSNAAIAYMMFRGNIFKSTNINTAVASDIRWSRLSNFATVTVDANNGYRTLGRKMAVDPSDPNKVYAGTEQNGVWVTSNGGTIWTQVSTSDIPISGSISSVYPGHTICFASSTTIYISTYGAQVRVSTNSGSTWAATTSGPTEVRHMVAGSDGRIWATNKMTLLDSDGSNTWRYSGGAWANLSPGMNADAIAVDPFDPTHVAIMHPQAALAWTNNGSATTPTWTLSSVSPYKQRNATDIPWLARSVSAENSSFSVGDVQFDPVTANKLWLGDGLGVWNATMPTSSSTVVQWTSITKGIEQLVSQEFVSVPNGPVYYIAQDRVIFPRTDLTSYPTGYYPDTLSGVNAGFSFDYAVNDNSFGVVVGWGQSGNVNAKTTNNGSTWTTFNDAGGGTLGGQIAVSTSTNWVLMPSNNPQNIYYTKDGGSTWNTVGISTTISSGLYGWQWATYVRSRVIVADRNQINKFYAYNYNPSANGGGMYVSTNSGDTWTRIYAGPLLTASSFSIIRSVPNYPGVLLMTSSSNGESAEFLRLTDDGLGTSTSLTKTIITSIAYVHRFGFGPTVPGQNYPIIFAYTDQTSAAGPAGIYKSEDNCATWTAIPGYPPLDSTDAIGALDGDKNVYGRIYVGFGGSGAVYYNP